LDEAAALELASLQEEVGEGPAAALAMRRTLLEKHTDSQPVRFALAYQLLQRGEAEGVPLMEAVLAAEPDAILPGAAALRDYYARQDDMPRARHWHEQHLERASLLQHARQERSRWLLADTIVPHGLGAEALAALLAQLRAIPQLRRAYLVRKVTRHFADVPMHVLGFQTSPWWALRSKATAAAVQEQILARAHFPGEAFVVNVEGRNREFAGKLRRVRGSRIL
jgi:hypothetical protein